MHFWGFWVILSIIMPVNSEISRFYSEARSIQNDGRILESYHLFEKILGLDGLDRSQRLRTMIDLGVAAAMIFDREKTDKGRIDWAISGENWLTQVRTEQLPDDPVNQRFYAAISLAHLRLAHSSLLDREKKIPLLETAYYEVEVIQEIIPSGNISWEFKYYSALHDLARKLSFSSVDAKKRKDWEDRWLKHVDSLLEMAKDGDKKALSFYLESKSNVLHALAKTEPDQRQKDLFNNHAFDLGLDSAELLAETGYFEVARDIVHKRSMRARELASLSTSLKQESYWLVLEYAARLKSAEYADKAGLTEQAAADLEISAIVARKVSELMDPDERLTWLKNAKDANLDAANKWEEVPDYIKADKAFEYASKIRHQIQIEFGDN